MSARIKAAMCFPDNPLLRERLEWFRDQKLALMIHFGLYVELGICASGPFRMRMPGGHGRAGMGAGRGQVS